MRDPSVIRDSLASTVPTRQLISCWPKTLAPLETVRLFATVARHCRVYESLFSPCKVKQEGRPAAKIPIRVRIVAQLLPPRLLI